MFPGMEADLSKRVSFRTDYKYAIWEECVIIYKVGNEYVMLEHMMPGGGIILLCIKRKDFTENTAKW